MNLGDMPAISNNTMQTVPAKAGIVAAMANLFADLDSIVVEHRLASA